MVGSYAKHPGTDGGLASKTVQMLNEAHKRLLSHIFCIMRFTQNPICQSEDPLLQSSNQFSESCKVTRLSLSQ